MADEVVPEEVVLEKPIEGDTFYWVKYSAYCMQQARFQERVAAESNVSAAAESKDPPTDNVPTDKSKKPTGGGGGGGGDKSKKPPNVPAAKSKKPTGGGGGRRGGGVQPVEYGESKYIFI